MYSHEQLVSWMLSTRRNAYNACMALRTMTKDESMKNELFDKLKSLNIVVDQIWDLSELIEKEARSSGTR